VRQKVLKGRDLQIPIGRALRISQPAKPKAAEKGHFYSGRVISVGRGQNSECVALRLQHFCSAEKTEFCQQLFREKRLVSEEIEVDRLAMPQIQSDGRSPIKYERFVAHLREFRPQPPLFGRQYVQTRERFHANRRTGNGGIASNFATPRTRCQ
jgi:hypothetical protein